MKRIILLAVILSLSLPAFSEPLQGTYWEIDNVARFDGVIGGYTENQIGKFVHKVIEYRQKSVLFDGKEFPVKKTVYEMWDADTLYRETRGTQSRGISFADIGISADEVEVISLNIPGYKNPGDFLLVINGDTMLTLYNGVYYWMKQKLDK